METLAIPGFPPLSKSKTVLSLTFSQLCQIPALTLAPGPRPFHSQHCSGLCVWSFHPCFLNSMYYFLYFLEYLKYFIIRNCLKIVLKKSLIINAK